MKNIWKVGKKYRFRDPRLRKGNGEVMTLRSVDSSGYLHLTSETWSSRTSTSCHSLYAESNIEPVPNIFRRVYDWVYTRLSLW